MRIIKTFLVSFLFLPFVLLGQFIGYLFGEFTIFMWKISTFRHNDGEWIIPFFSDFFPYIISGIFGGWLAAILISRIYKYYHPKAILILPIIIGCLAILANVIALVKLGPSLKEISIIIGSVTSLITFIRFLKDEFPPILKEIEKDNRVIKSEILKKIKPETELISKIEKLEGVKIHRSILDETLTTASDRILILSGFTSKYVIDEVFLLKVKKALRRGVSIYMAFGYVHPSKKVSNQSYNEREMQKLNKIEDWVKKNKIHGNLFICNFPNHAKVLIKDSEFVIEGSFNWLSTGDESINLESSYKVNDSEFTDIAFNNYKDKFNDSIK